MILMHYAKRKAKEVRAKIKDALSEKNTVDSSFYKTALPGRLDKISEDGEEAYVQEWPEGKQPSKDVTIMDKNDEIRVWTQVHRARVKFFKVSMDIISAGSGLGFFSKLPAPLRLGSAVCSAACVVHLEMVDIRHTLNKQKLEQGGKKEDFVRDRSVF